LLIPNYSRRELYYQDNGVSPRSSGYFLGDKGGEKRTRAHLASASRLRGTAYLLGNQPGSSARRRLRDSVLLWSLRAAPQLHSPPSFAPVMV
jgi:hypothetical protein